MNLIKSILKFSSIFRRTKNMVLESLYLALSLIIAIILYTNADMFNSFILFNLKLGSTMLLIVSFFVFKYTWSILSFFLGSYKRLGTVIKFIILAILIIFALYVLFNQDTTLSILKNDLDMIDFSRFNPVIKANITNSTG